MVLALSLKHLGRRDEALATLRRAVQCNPEYAELHLYLGETLVSWLRKTLNKCLSGCVFG
jgi:tetratricopeptide (TPR) repeat protein